MIIAAAVNVCDRIYEGRRHGEAIHEAVECGETPPITSQMQGFINHNDAFFDRVEAREAAVASGQIPFNKDRVGKPLISEELW